MPTNPVYTDTSQQKYYYKALMKHLSKYRKEAAKEYWDDESQLSQQQLQAIEARARASAAADVSSPHNKNCSPPLYKHIRFLIYLAWLSLWFGLWALFWYPVHKVTRAIPWDEVADCNPQNGTVTRLYPCMNGTDLDGRAVGDSSDAVVANLFLWLFAAGGIWAMYQLATLPIVRYLCEMCRRKLSKSPEPDAELARKSPEL
jgi:hypothetical protein